MFESSETGRNSVLSISGNRVTTMTMATSTQSYGESSYWDNRYANESLPFDWYQKYASLAPLIRLYIPLRNHSVLVVGAGNSTFSEDMVEDGYQHVANIDISSVVIEAMKNKYSNLLQLQYIQMDARDMRPFTPGLFDAVVDKGTLDSLLCGSNSLQNAKQMLAEVWRVLKDKGVYILITYGSPTYRLPLLNESCSWRVKLHIIDKFVQEEKTEDPTWELTQPIPLEDGSSLEELIGNNRDVHYIYVCLKGEAREECFSSGSSKGYEGDD